VGSKKTSRREDLQLLLNWQARSTLGALPTMPLRPLIRASGLTPAPVCLDYRQQQFTARLANAYQGSKLEGMYNHPTSGTPICSVIKKSTNKAERQRSCVSPSLEEAPAVKTVIMSDDPPANRQAIHGASQ